MTASIGSDGGQYIGEQVLVDRFLRPLPPHRGAAASIKVGGAARPLNGVLVGQKAHIGTAVRGTSTARRAADLIPHHLGDMRRWPLR